MCAEWRRRRAGSKRPLTGGCCDDLGSRKSTRGLASAQRRANVSADEALVLCGPPVAAAAARVHFRVCGSARSPIRAASHRANHALDQGERVADRSRMTDSRDDAAQSEFTGAAALVAARRESDLIEQAKAGSVDAYEKLIAQFEQFAYRVAYMIARDAGDAEEATQDAFIKAYRSLPRFRRGAPFKPWLLKIVANEARSRRRSRLRRGELAARAISESTSPPIEGSAEASLLSAEQRRLLLVSIESLPEKMRDVVTCRYLLELSEIDTAAALGIRVGTVKSRLSRALEKLEVRLGGKL